MVGLLTKVITVSAIVGAIAGAITAYIVSEPSDEIKLCEKAISTVFGSTNPRDITIANYLIKHLRCRIVFKG
jgi:hypothetical protein